jgi:RNA polymerase sigma-32 factor
MTREEENTNQAVIIAKNKDSLPVRSEDAGFAEYVRSVQKFPILTAEEEFEYARLVFEEHDKEAAKMLIQSHLRLVVKMAGKFKNYGLSTRDLVAEGNLGLMQAVKKFDPYKGFRFSTYSMWWIRAFMQDYVLRSWSLVKIGTTSAQKKLFFNLSKIKKRLGIKENSLDQSQVAQIAHELNVTEKEVSEMSSRLAQGDTSLNNPIGDDEDAKEMGDLIAASQESQEEISIKNQEAKRKSVLFRAAFATLNEREQDILTKRQLLEESLTLEELSQIYQVSRERIRQIEENAIKKIKKEIARLQEKN